MTWPGLALDAADAAAVVVTAAHLGEELVAVGVGYPEQVGDHHQGERLAEAGDELPTRADQVVVQRAVHHGRHGVLVLLEALGVISFISRARWSVCIGGSKVGSWSLNGSSSRCGNEFRHVGAPSTGTGKPGKGPVTEMHDENRSASPATSLASSQPVTIHTPWCGSRTTGHRACRASRYGRGSATTPRSMKKSTLSVIEKSLTTMSCHTIGKGDASRSYGRLPADRKGASMSAATLAGADRHPAAPDRGRDRPVHPAQLRGHLAADDRRRAWLHQSGHLPPLRTREQLLTAVLEPIIGELRAVVEDAETRRGAHARAERMLDGYARSQCATPS